MTTRILPVEEWPKLDGTYLAPVWRTFREGYHFPMVVEEGDQIVGTWVFQWWAHVEGLSIAADHQKKGRVGALLFQAMSDFVLGLGAQCALTGSASDEVTELLAHVGAEPMMQYVVPFRRLSDQKRGVAFHRALERAGVETNHADDPEHDAHVGAALRMAFDDGRPVDAQKAYNTWALGAGYEPVSEFSRDGESTVVTFPSMVLRFNVLGHLEGALTCR